MLELTSLIELQIPPVVRFGDGAVKSLASWTADKGFKAPFIIADAANKDRIDLLGLTNPTCFTDVVPEPSIENLDAAVAAAKGCDLVIGFGGGSAMDIAKLVAVMVSDEVAFADISGPHRAPARKVGLVQIPTTAGTGSEVGTRALVTDLATMSKVATESVHMLADVALVDPLMTVTVPAPVTAATGVDAMAHCVEAFTSKRSHPIIDGFALQGIQLVGKFLKRAVKDGNDKEARTGMALAAFYGGICLGPVNTTSGHAVAYPLGTRHKLPHGIANALIFPHTLAANAPVAPQKTAFICEALGFSASEPAEICKKAKAFCEDLGLDMALSAYGVDEADLPLMAKEAHAIRRLLDWNPADLSQEDIEGLYRAALQSEQLQSCSKPIFINPKEATKTVEAVELMRFIGPTRSCEPLHCHSLGLTCHDIVSDKSVCKNLNCWNADVSETAPVRALPAALRRHIEESHCQIGNVGLSGRRHRPPNQGPDQPVSKMGGGRCGPLHHWRGTGSSRFRRKAGQSGAQ